MENDLESPAQDPNLPDAGNEVEVTDEAKKVADGVQKRIDELTAQVHQSRRDAESLRDQNMQLLATQVAASQRAVEVSDPYPDMDPQVRKMVADITGSLKREFQGQVQQLRSAHEIDLMSREARSEAAKMGADDALQNEAAGYVANLRNKGLPINAEDAAIYALGRALKEGRFKPGQQQRIAGPPATIGSVRTANINQQQTKPLPNNFDDLGPDEQIAVLQKRGNYDIPL